MPISSRFQHQCCLSVSKDHHESKDQKL